MLRTQRKDSILINVRSSNEVRIYYNGKIDCHFLRWKTDFRLLFELVNQDR